MDRMKDKWKKFAEDHSEEFNEESPNDTFFGKIAPEIKSGREPKMIRLSTVLRVAAAVVVLIGVSLFFLMNRDTGKATSVAATDAKTEKDERLVLSRINPELAETEYY